MDLFLHCRIISVDQELKGAVNWVLLKLWASTTLVMISNLLN